MKEAASEILACLQNSIDAQIIISSFRYNDGGHQDV